MDWAEALEAVRRRRWRGQTLAGVTEDTARLRPAMVFVARIGLHHDGHTFLRQARASGAAFTVGARPVAHGLPDVLVPDPAAALAHLVAAWHGDPGENLRIVGITGTNGKTTVAHLTAAIFTAAGHPTGTIGTLGCRFSDRGLATTHTTPPPEVLYPLLAEWREADATHVVMEVSAQSLTQRRTAACRFSVAALTCLTREHGECFPDDNAYQAAKQALFTAVRGAAVLPADDPAFQAFAAAASHARLVTFGRGGDIDIGWIGGGLTGSVGEIHFPHSRPQRLELRLPGRHNLRNAACAAAIAWAAGVPAEVIVAALRGAVPAPGRANCQWLPDLRAWAVVDYAHNPGALVAVLRWLRESVRGCLYVVIGARGGRDTGKRPLMGAAIAALADGAIFTADRPGAEDPAEAVAQMLQAARGCGLRARFVRDRAEAIAAATRLLRAGDCLLVTGKGSEPWDADDSTSWPYATDRTDVAVLRDLGAQPIPLHPPGEMVCAGS